MKECQTGKPERHWQRGGTRHEHIERIAHALSAALMSAAGTTNEIVMALLKEGGSLAVNVTTMAHRLRSFD